MFSSMRSVPGLIQTVPKMRRFFTSAHLSRCPAVLEILKSHHFSKAVYTTLAVTSSKKGQSPVYMDQRRQSSFKGVTTALAVVKDLKHVKSSPRPALILGASGVIPFVAPPMYMMMTGTYMAGMAFSQVAYGACILSFLGAVRWGLSLAEDGIVRPNWVNLGYSVTPSLVAWLALLMPTPFALSTLMVGLGGAAYMDLTMFGYPAWFKALRFILSFAAILALWTTLMCMLVFPGKAKKRKEAMKQALESKHQEESLPLVEAVVPVVVEEVKSIETSEEERKGEELLPASGVEKVGGDT